MRCKEKLRARHARKLPHFTVVPPRQQNDTKLFEHVTSNPILFCYNTWYLNRLPPPRKHLPGMSQPSNNKPSAPTVGEQGAAPGTSQSLSPVQRQVQDSGPTALQHGIALLVLGTSAGLTLYTRKADSMLRRMEQVAENQLKRQRPVFGPPTREYAEKMKPRIDKDEFF
jgi:hypothetical protein